MKNRPLEYLSSVFWWNLQPNPTPATPVTPLLLLWLLLAVSGDLSGAGRAVCASPVSRYSAHCQTNNVPVPKYQRHFLSERHGHFSTPNFPGPFPLPFSGSWIINATGYEPDSYITLYLTQMYLTRGVQVVQYDFHNGTHTQGRKTRHDEIHALRSRPYSVSSIRIKANYLEVQVNVHDLANSNLRVENLLMNVYGFNITYEIQPNNSRIRNDSCNAVNCTFNGHCYASKNYSQFQCSCLAGFSGAYCQHGPDCNPSNGINICKNGGVCGYRFGHSVVRCSCPPHYNGSLCEFRRETIPSKECLSRFKLNCSHHCAMKDSLRAVCQCPTGYALKSDNLTCYPLHPQRILCEADITRSINTYVDRTQMQKKIETALQNEVQRISASLLSVGGIDFVKDPEKVIFQLWSSEKMVDNSQTWNSGQAFALRRIPRSFVRTDKQWPSAVNSSLADLRRGYSVHMNDTIITINNSICREVPALVIEWVRLDVRQARVREGYPFIVACKSNGSDQLEIRWYKDGYLVEVQHSLRNITIELHPPDLRGFYTSYLEIKKATASDRGEYECRASDWGQMVRSSVFLEVVTPPILNLMPANHSVETELITANSTLILTCRDENDLARRTLNGTYTWYKNGQIVNRSSCDEVYEDLFPVGSLLKISNVQHSTRYSCERANEAGRTIQETLISVFERGMACEKETKLGVDWQTTAVNATNSRFCPKGYVGVARRKCGYNSSAANGKSNASAAFKGHWESPDFTGCSNNIVNDLNKQMKMLSLGYSTANMSVVSVIDKLWRHVSTTLSQLNASTAPTSSLNRKSSSVKAESSKMLLLPGEGNAVLDLLLKIERYMWKKDYLLADHFWNTTAVTYLELLDSLLSVPQYILPDSVTPVARLLQNHVKLLVSRRTVLPVSLKNIMFDAAVLLDNSQNKNGSVTASRISYRWIWPSVKLKGNYLNSKVIAPPSLVLPDAPDLDRANLTLEFHVPDSLAQTEVASNANGDGFMCAILQLQTPNVTLGTSASWDLNNCTVEIISTSTLQCHCSAVGTTLLLHVRAFPMEGEDATMDLWKAVWMTGVISHLISMTSFIVLSSKFYWRRTVWSLLQIQLAISTFPVSASYFVPPERIVDDSLWTFLLSFAVYWYMSTVVAMAWHSKENAKHFGRSQSASECLNRQNLRLVGFSYGLPLILLAMHGLLQALADKPPDGILKSWLSEIDSVSSVLFYLTFCSLLLITIGLYVLSLRRTRHFDELRMKETSSHFQSHRKSSCERCCLMLAVMCILWTGCIIIDQHWKLLTVHCASAIFNCLLVLMWSVVMMTFSEHGVFLPFFWHKFDKPNDLQNGTVLVESPRRVPDAASTAASSSRSTNVRESAGFDGNLPSSTSAGDTVRSKRLKRTGPASLPLLQRAGLGLDVQRAFATDSELSPRHHPANKNAAETHVLVVGQTSQDPPGPPSGLHNNPHQLLPLRATSTVPSQGTQREDSDSGLGPSGGSQIFVGFEKLTDAWKALWQIRLKFPHRVLLAWNGSFRSRQSTMSSITTEHGGERSNSVTTTETEVATTPLTDSDHGLLYSLRRSRTRWVEDYGHPIELDSDSSDKPSESGVLKPFRGQCLIRCSPEKIRGIWNRTRRYEGLRSSTVDCFVPVPVPVEPTVQKNCERCWHNPETPACDSCRVAGLSSYSGAQQSGGPIFIRAIVEKNPQSQRDGGSNDSNEYLAMDAAGSLAVDRECIKPPTGTYYNMQVSVGTVRMIEIRPNSFEVSDQNSNKNCVPLKPRSLKFPSTASAPPTHFELRRKISDGRIMKRYRPVLRTNVLPSSHSLSGRHHRRLSHLTVPGAEILSQADVMQLTTV